ncbi:hypothetical protein B0H14DRAFT_2671619 [Mycena olivaceomarginata]|nr:hypothetical protein B0H14DRAFT_2671619 [Mycena olivaceomarginata]
MPSRQLLRDPTSNPLEPELSKELSHWEQLIFFDMQNDQNNPNNGSQRRPQTAEGHGLLAQLAATGTMFPSMHGGPYPHNQGSASGYNAGPSNTRSFVSPANLSSSYGSQPYPYFRGGPPPPPPLPQSQNHPSPTEPSRTRGRSHSQAGPSTSNATADADDDADDYEDNELEIQLLQKKQKTLALERTVSDLTGRAEDLEREAADLRRENGWLKEIVMLKGGRLAGIDLSGNPDTRGQGSGQREQRRDSAEHDGSDSEQSAEDRGQGSGKSKGKGKAKKK